MSTHNAKKMPEWQHTKKLYGFETRAPNGVIAVWPSLAQAWASMDFNTTIHRGGVYDPCGLCRVGAVCEVAQ